MTSVMNIDEDLEDNMEHETINESATPARVVTARDAFEAAIVRARDMV